MLKSIVSIFANHCEPNSFFGIPAWYEYLHRGGYVVHDQTTNACEYKLEFITEGKVLDLAPLALIFLGILDILLRLGALVAAGFIIYGGIQYVLSQGEPDKAKKAFGTILNAAIGLGVTIVAATVVSFIGRAVTS